MKPIPLLVVSMFLVIFVSAQSKSERKKNKIKSVTEWETITTEGKTNTYKSLYEEFDRSGHNILKIEYGTDESILHKETAIFDIYGNKTEETVMDTDKHKNIRRVFKYNAFKNRTEETEYDDKGTVRKKTLFTYDSNGNKVGETINDAYGNCIKKIQYTYNAKNLRIKKETFRGKAQVESLKKWDYVYF